MCEICSKLTIVSSVFIVNFEQLLHIVLLLKTPLFREKFTCGQIPVQNSNIDIRITFIGFFAIVSQLTLDMYLPTWFVRCSFHCKKCTWLLQPAICQKIFHQALSKGHFSDLSVNHSIWRNSKMQKIIL